MPSADDARGAPHAIDATVAPPDGPASDSRAILELLVEGRPRFGRYQLLGKLRGHGAAAVYEARDPSGLIVALKRLESPRSPLDVERFKRETALTRSLATDNIIPVLDVGEADGVPYYTMPFMEGGTLVDWHGRDKRPPDVLARVMARVAWAVHHAHQHHDRILHRDLKPANILMDGMGDDARPYVADFGIAKRLQAAETGTRNAIVGTLDYMAPEQALGDPDRLTSAADIYGLGVVLYELLTTTVPVPGASVGEFLKRLWSAEPIVPPHKLRAGVHRGLENICLKCLENDPLRRYPSAKELARDFERVRDGQPPAARPPSPPARVARWMRRHPRVAYAAATAAVVAAVAGAAFSIVWSAHQREQDRILDSNAAIASGKAGAALFQLHEYADHVAAIARHPLVRTILARGTVRDAAPELQPLLGGFDSLFVMTADARILEQWPAAASYVYQRDYTFRDYFRGARYLAETRTPGAYIARAFRSESHGTLEFGISAPVLDEQGTQLGLIVGTLQANSVFGAVRMEEAPQSGKTGRIITALIGPRGHDRASGPEAPAPSDFTFLVHPRMDRGVEYPVRTPSPERLRQRFGLSAPPGHQLSLQYAPALQIADYHDPIPGFPGDWLAALAPVGKTGFLMLVETPKETALPWPRALRGPFASRAVPRLAFLIAIAGGLLLGATIRRARRRRTRSG